MYWLCIKNERNWKSIKRNKIWGTKFKGKVPKVKKGDKLVICLKHEKFSDEIKELIIVAIYEANSDVLEDSSEIFNKSYPYRIGFKPIKILEKPLEFEPLVSKLSFIKNKRVWDAYLQKPIVELLLVEDIKLILEKS